MPRRVNSSIHPAAADSLDTLDSAALVTQVRSLLAEAQALSSRLAALNEVAVAMQAELDVETILQALARQARWVLDFQHCSIALADETSYQVRVLQGEPAPVRTFPLQAGAIGRALVGKHALLLHHLADADAAPAGMRSALIMPLRSAGTTIGTLNFYSRAAQHYTQDDQRIASALSVQLSAILLNERLFTEATRTRDQLRIVLESIGDAVLVTDSAGRIQLLNSAMRRLLRLPDGELAGRRALWLRRGAGTPIPWAAVRPLAAAWLSRQPGGASGMLQLPDGPHLEWAYAPLVSTGAVVGAVLTFRNVSARIELEQLRDDMLHMLVHDLRTPLSGLIMGLDMLALPEGIIGVEERKDMLGRTRSAADRLLGQVNTILILSKLEAGRLELDRESTDLAALLERAHSLVLSLARQNQQELLLDIAADLPVVCVDVQLIQRVVENLLGNALKFTPLYGRVTVGARNLPEADAVEIWVEDSGAGVPDEFKAHIFEKYGQAPGEARRRGTGLGLTYCKLAVDAHRGQIGVRDGAHGGSVFWFWLPVGAASK
jgi:two-component system, NtrC family, sensor histidine kinase KinB